MSARVAIILADLDATLDRHWFGSEQVLRDPIPAVEPPVRPNPRDLGKRWRVDHWIEPERIIDPTAAAAFLPHHRLFRSRAGSLIDATAGNSSMSALP